MLRIHLSAAILVDIFRSGSGYSLEKSGQTNSLQFRSQAQISYIEKVLVWIHSVRVIGAGQISEASLNICCGADKYVDPANELCE